LQKLMVALSGKFVCLENNTVYNRVSPAILFIVPVDK
jgi:hypothetical protein